MERLFMYPHFVEGIITGQFKKLPIAEIRKMVQEHYFGFESLTELTGEENLLLEDFLVKKLDKTLNRETVRFLCESVYIHEGGNPYFVEIYIKDATPYDPYDHGKLRLLSPKEKIDLFSNPSKWQRINIHELRTSYPATYYGNRNLLAEDGYFRSADEFRDLLKKSGNKVL